MNTAAMAPARSTARRSAFGVGMAVVTVLLAGGFHLAGSEYLWFAAYVVLQYVALATAWNILGGYAGYVNFGTAGFFGVGCYTSVLLAKFGSSNLLLMVLAAALVNALLGLGMGWLTLKLRGAYFSIATLCLAVLLQTLVTNWDYLGGSRGAYLVRPDAGPLFASPVEYLFIAMLLIAVLSVCIGRGIETSRLGRAYVAIRDDELAAEAAGVPTLRLKLVATTVSGALMGMAGAPAAYYSTFIEPSSAFGLAYAANTMAMALIGGLGHWAGPVIGAVLISTIQQVAMVTISSAFNLLLVGILMLVFLIAAPQGIVGLIKRRRGGRP